MKLLFIDPVTQRFIDANAPTTMKGLAFVNQWETWPSNMANRKLNALYASKTATDDREEVKSSHMFMVRSLHVLGMYFHG